MCGAREAEAFGRFCDWLTSSTTSRCRPSSSATSTRRSTSPARSGPALDLVAPGWLPAARPRSCGATSTTSGCSASSPSSRCTPVWRPTRRSPIYAVITYMDTRQRGVRAAEGGMHAAARSPSPTAAEKAGATFRYGTRVDRILLRARHVGPGRRRAPGGRRAWSQADAVVANPDLPVAYRTLLPGTPMPRDGAARAATRRRPSCGTSACAAPLPAGRRAPQHPLRPRLGRRLPRPILRRRHPHARPVDARQRAVARTSRPMAPAGRATCSTCSSPCPTSTAGSTGPASAAARATTSYAPARRRSATRRPSRSRSCVDPLDWEAQGMERGTPFALSHRFRQTGPFRPGNLERAGAGPGVRRLGHGARRRRADGARVRRMLARASGSTAMARPR